MGLIFSKNKNKLNTNDATDMQTDNTDVIILDDNNTPIIEEHLENNQNIEVINVLTPNHHNTILPTIAEEPLDINEEQPAINEEQPVINEKLPAALAEQVTTIPEEQPAVIVEPEVVAPEVVAVPEVVAPEVVAPEVVAPEVVAAPEPVVVPEVAAPEVVAPVESRSESIDSADNATKHKKRKGKKRY